MQITYTIKPEDLDALSAQAGQSSLQMFTRFVKTFLLLTVFGIAAALLFTQFLPASPHRIVHRAPQNRNFLPETLGLFLPMVLFVGFYFLLMRSGKSQRAKLFETVPAYKEPQTTEITPEYLYHQDATGEVKTRWKGIQKIVETATHIFFWVSPNEAHVVPKRAFANAEDATQFAQLATKYWEQAQSK